MFIVNIGYQNEAESESTDFLDNRTSLHQPILKVFINIIGYFQLNLSFILLCRIELTSRTK
ncbi:MAG: hypothetical protein ACJAZQ_002846 [Cognaticolwellia sp.]|jgi:hypothetical protein